MDMEIPYKATLDDTKRGASPLPGHMPTMRDGGLVPPETPDGWTKWTGGKCPLPARTAIEVRFRNGCHSVGFAGNLAWSHSELDGDIVLYRQLPEVLRRRGDPKHTVSATPAAEQVAQPEYTGSDVNYYIVDVPNPKRLAPYTAECEDIIEALGLNFAEGCAFKAIWRRAAARQGRVKKGYTDGLYDAEKVEYYGGRMIAQEKRKLAGETK